MSVVSIRDAITEQFENNGLAETQFYYDNYINIGYGFNISADPSASYNALFAAGVALGVTQAYWNSTIVPLAAAPSLPRPGSPGLKERFLADAMLALGFIPMFNPTNEITGISPDTAVNPVADAQFLSDVLSPNNVLGGRHP